MFLCQVCRVLLPNKYSTIWINTNLTQANLKRILSLFSIKFLSCKNSIINSLQLNSFSIKIANTTPQLKVLQLPISIFSNPLQIVKCSTPIEWWNVVTYGLKEDIPYTTILVQARFSDTDRTEKSDRENQERNGNPVF